jgi:peroxiredoxin (alkyl hydroperoxide reductase subunit C)
MTLPENLPVPEDDGAAAHLLGSQVASVALAATDGSSVDLSAVHGRTVLYAYPRTGRPGEDPLVAHWDEIPGARGCTPESCGFRDHHAELRAAGVAQVFGLSTQDTPYQQEAVARLALPFPLLSDAARLFCRAMSLPTFEAAGQTLLQRLTLLIDEGSVSHVWYPVFPPDRHAAEVLDYLRGQA